VSSPERYDYRKRRVSENKYQRTPSGKELLLSVDGDLFFYHLDSDKWDQLTATAETESDPKLSPDGKQVAFRRAHDLYTLDIASRKVKRLTEDGSTTLLNGELDWVYPEELDLGTAFWWSPDSKHLAYMQFDIGREMVYPQVSLVGPKAVLEPERYPQAGTPNAEVHIGVISPTGGTPRWMDLGETRGYLFARVYWSPDSSKLAIERFNRVQNKLDLMLADAGSGTSKSILHESDQAWINLNDLFHFLADGQFIWGSERDGFQHLYLYGPDGTLRNRITAGDWEVNQIAGIDEAKRTISYTSTEASPLERQLFSIKFSGQDKKRLTQAAGTHSVSLSPSHDYFMDTFSSLSQPSSKTLHKIDGTAWTVFREADRKLTDEYEVLPTELVNVKAADGTLLYARLIKPANFKSGEKYPAIVMVYGGPGVQSIHNAWSGATWDQALAQRGFVIWQLDNRGSMGRGHAFETPINRRMGKVELADQLEGIRYLVGQGFVDPNRIGINGWSYGGYMTINALLNAPDVFRAGIAGAPVTNWQNYDTIYTERYLGLPSENPDGYKVSSLVDYADKLKAKLLMIHNIEDDNVLFQNTIQMSDSLERAGKLFDMVIYPGKSHGVEGRLRKHLLETTTDFFEKNLK
jgi:dipeptidyl-peptidase-4